MGRKIGLLPASGSASRLHGIPKFALPYDDTKTLLQYHVDMMLEVVDEVRVCTRKSWLPLLTELNVNETTDISVMEPSTMNDALFRMMHDYAGTSNNHFIVGMPDTAWIDSSENPYLKLSEVDSKTDITLLTNPFREALRGKVGQVEVNKIGNVTEIIDKDRNCEFTRIWTAFRMNHFMLNQLHSSPSDSFRELLKREVTIDSIHLDAEYHDLGSIDGLRMFYASREKSS